MKIIKKTLCALLVLTLFMQMNIICMASENIKVKIDGREVAFDVPPQIINDRTMVPLRAIFEALGATVDWNNDTQTVTSTKDDMTIKLTIGTASMLVNEETITLDSPACIVEGRTLVPVRAVSEAFDYKVKWEEIIKTVLISTTGEFIEENITMYAPDGRTINVPISQVEANKSVGWYTYPVVTIYTEAGNSAIISASEIEAYKAIGWYTEA